ncbi:MFS transporter [Actinomadura sp. HBU206391]|uniref:MFS transporter n=1 Tax=Actinomadura sp. HBU206391 TaxID=2731692 RepID=UPI0016504B9D|nr:MFS transporter [Actinomadura sp. HBU206391]MBC6460222.1 MFS transporter [Actinomadura sp. HBU206391]
MSSTPPPVARPRAAIPLLASGAAFLAMLDATVTNLAIPDLHEDFPSASVQHLTWIITLYAVLFAALLAPAGRLADVVGRRTLFRVGVGLFTAMSLLCALAPNLPVLLAARGLQGAGAAAMIPASLAILLHDTPADRRARAIGLWSAAGALAAAVGPSVGGVLVDSLHWRSLFYINVPIGLALVYFARVVPGSGSVGGRLPDLFGTALLGGGIGALTLGVTQGQTWQWGDIRTVSALAGGAVAVGLALWRSTRHPTPAVETSLWRNRTFAVANVASLMFGAALLPTLLIGVLFLTKAWHYSELQAGLAMTPGALTAAVAAVAVSRLTPRYGPRPAVVGGSVIMTAATVWTLLVLSEEPSFLTFWLPAGALLGLGIGALSTGTASAAALSVAPQRFAGATGLNTTARQLGGALGVATLAAILPTRTPATIDDFVHVYVFSAVVVLLAGIAGLWLTLRPQVAPAPSDSPKETVAA